MALVPDFFQFLVVVGQRADCLERRLVVLALVVHVAGLQLEVRALPQVERVERLFVVEFRLDSGFEHVENLRAELEQEHITFVLGVLGIADHVDVRDVVCRAAVLARGGLLRLRRVFTTELEEVFVHRVGLAQRGTAVLDVPLVALLDEVFEAAHVGEFFALGCWQEADHGRTVTGLVHVQFPEAVVLGVPTILVLFDFLGQVFDCGLGLFLECCE